MSQMDQYSQTGSDIIPMLRSDPTAVGPSINKYKSMLDPDNTPFRWVVGLCQ